MFKGKGQRMKYWCENCKEVIEEDDLSYYGEPSEYFGRPVEEPFWVCPNCGDIPVEYDHQDKECEDCVFFEMEECPWYGYSRETICGSFVGVDE